MPVGIGEQAFNVLLRFVVDKKTLGDIETGTTSLQEAMNKMDGAGQLLAVSAYKLQPALDAQIKKTAELQNAWWKTQRVLRASSFVFNELALAGAGIVTPLLLLANKFATDAQKSADALNPVAEQWLKLQESFKKSADSVGETTAKELLPLMDELATIAAKGADFVAKHPKIVDAALEIGAAVATVSVLGKLVSDGVKFYVDVKFVLASAQNLLAGELMVKAAQQNLAAALAMEARGGAANAAAAQELVLGGAGSVSGTGMLASLGALLTNVLTTVIPLAIGAGIGHVLANGINRATGRDTHDRNLGDNLNTAFQLESLGILSVTKGLRDLGVISADTASKIGKTLGGISKWIGSVLGTADAADEAANSLDNLTLSLKGSKNEQKIVEAYTKMVEENAKAAADYADTKTKINADADSKLLKAANDLSDDLNKIWTNLGRDIDKINSDAADAQSKADDKFKKDNLKADEQFQLQQAKTEQESNKEILRMTQDHKRDLEKLEATHNQNIEKLVGDRDALGIVDENRRYAQELAQANQASSVEIQRRREDTAQKLADQADEFRRARAQRLEEYNADTAQRQAETVQKIKEAQEKAKQDAADRRAQYEAERLQLLQERAQKLAEARDQYIKEMNQRREAFLQTVSDLDASLLGERVLKQKYYNQMLADAEKFLADYRSRMPSTAMDLGTGSVSVGLPHKAAGDYVSGAIMTGELGTEWLLNARNTRIAEQAMGHRLTQESVMNQITGGGDQTIQIVVGGGVTVAQVKRMLKDSNNLKLRDLVHALGG